MAVVGTDQEFFDWLFDPRHHAKVAVYYVGNLMKARAVPAITLDKATNRERVERGILSSRAYAIYAAARRGHCDLVQRRVKDDCWQYLAIKRERQGGSGRSRTARPGEARERLPGIR